MPYKKRKGKRLRQLQRRYYKANTPASMWNSIRKLKRMINVEYKQRYEKLTSSSTGTTPAFFSLVTLSQGQTQNERIGAQAKFINLFFNSIANIEPTTNTETFVRYIVFIDKQCNGANPSGADLLQDATAINNIVSPLNMDNKFRFKVLYNRVIKLSENLPINQVKWFKKLLLPVRYDGTGAAVTALTSNNLLVCVFSDQPVGSQPLITWNIKTSYVDN